MIKQQHSPPSSLPPQPPAIGTSGGSRDDEDCEDSGLPRSSPRKTIPVRKKATGSTSLASFFSAIDKKNVAPEKNGRKKLAIKAGSSSPSPPPATKSAASSSAGNLSPWKRKKSKKIVYKSPSENKQQLDDDDATAPTTASSISCSIHSCSIHSLIHSSIHSVPGAQADDGKKQQRRRTVRFNRKVRIRKIPLLKDMSAEEIEAKYYSNQELVDVRNSLRARVRVMIEINYNCSSITDGEDTSNQNSDNDADGVVGEACDFDNFEDDDDNDVFYLRGLEHEFPDGKQRRRESKTLSRDAVLEEQNRQRECSRHQHNPGDVDDGSFVYCDDPMHAIAEVYQLESASSLRHAINVAKLDEIIAKRIYTAADR